MTKSIPIGEKLLKHTPFGTRVEGHLVAMTIGPRECLMSYDTALRLSAMLRNAGRIAKRHAGDHSRTFTVFAHLTDANADELDLQRNRDGTAVFGSVRE